MDIVGPLPTESGNTYILTIQDLLIKYSVTVPFKQATSSEIAEALVEKFINPYTAPYKAWITDQGSNFISSMMHHVARKYKISMYETTTNRPQSNGSIERYHHVLMEYLKHGPANAIGINI
ncbi:hypothetical protein HN011_009613 [Eciton burchellii]|nr:hypothetical protein HN011_009613 [Eciton burchellii]